MAKKQILINFHGNDHKFSGVQEGYTYDTLRIKYFTPHRVHFIAIKEGMKMISFAKKMNYIDGNVVVKFGKDQLVIGEYKEKEVV